MMKRVMPNIMKGCFIMIKVTKEAADKLKGALAQQEQEGLYIRIFVSGMG